MNTLRARLIIVFITAVLLDANSIASFRFLMDKNWIGMFMVVFINPFLCLPMNHYNIEAKSLRDRIYIAMAFASGSGFGVITIRPFFV